MKNKYEIRGEITVIFIVRRDGSIHLCIIDTDDLEKVSRHTWSVSIQNNHSKYISVKANWCKPTNGVTSTTIARSILDAPVGMVVDHLNGDTLDNRKVNLRIITQKENTQNLNVLLHSNSSGIRGVGFRKDRSKYTARIHVDGEQLNLGVYDTKEEAGAVVNAARLLHHPFSSEYREYLLEAA